MVAGAGTLAIIFNQKASCCCWPVSYLLVYNASDEYKWQQAVAGQVLRAYDMPSTEEMLKGSACSLCSLQRGCIYSAFH